MTSPARLPFLLSFGGDLRRLIARFVLPPPPRLSWWRALGQAICAALLAVGSAALVISGAALLSERVLGRDRRQLAFPYLDHLLHWAASVQHLWLMALAACLGLAGLLALGQGLSQPLRRRWWALAGLLTLLVLATAVDVAFTEGNGAVMDALNQRSAAGFWGTAAGLVAIYLLTLPIQWLNSYGQQRWALAWRRSSTMALQRAYLGSQAYYQLQSNPTLLQRLDNPDQRISDDVPLAVGGASTLFFGFCASLLALGAYIVVLFQISFSLVASLAVAALLGNGLILRLVRRLGLLSFRQQALEADYRFALVHVRSHAESLAFLRGEAAVAQGLGRRFSAVLLNFERLIRWRALVEQSSGLYGFLMQFVPYLVLSTAYFSGRVSLGDLTVGSIAFGQVQSSLSFLIDRAETVSGLFASMRRIADLETALGDGCSPGTSAPEPSAPPTAASCAGTGASANHPANPDAGEVLLLTDLAVAHPAGGRPLVDHLNLSLAKGERLLISGPSGAGKTSLLRVLAGLASAADGEVKAPNPAQRLVLPQTPFLPLGSLRDQLLFPGTPQTVPATDAALRQLMRQVGLDALAERHQELAVEEDWARVLSGGEQQRIGFARLLLHRPALVILDEASSALDLDAEADLHRLVVEAGPTVVSVGHRSSLRQFHQRLLTLDGRGGWRLEAINPASS